MRSAIRLHVLGGRHAGATQVLDQSRFIIGNSLKSDIVLTDPSVLPAHAQITPSGSTMELEALDGEIVLEGQTIRPGSKIQIRSPSRFALGEAEIEVTEVPLQAKSSLGSLLKIGGLALLFLVAAVKVYFDMPRHGTGLTAKLDAASAAKAVQEPPSLQASMSQAAAEALTERLLSLNIASISVKPGNGTVSASGTIDPRQKDDWQSSEVWFDEKFGQQLILQSNVTALPKKPVKAPIAIQSVWSGESPYLIDSEGNKYFEGSTLKDGWVLEKIQDGKILISKNKEPLLLRF